MEIELAETPVTIELAGAAPQIEFGGAPLTVEITVADVQVELAFPAPTIEFNLSAPAIELALSQITLELSLPGAQGPPGPAQNYLQDADPPPVAGYVLAHYKTGQFPGYPNDVTLKLVTSP